MKEVVDTIKSRIQNPIFSYFVLAFVAFNWRGLLFIFMAEASVLTKIAYFENETSLYTTLWFPALAAAAGGLFHPWISFAFTWLASHPARLKNSIEAKNENSYLYEQLIFEKDRNQLLREREEALIEKSQRDKKIAEIDEPEIRAKLEQEIAEGRKAFALPRFSNLADQAAKVVQASGIEISKISTTGGYSGVRIWTPTKIALDKLRTLHKEISFAAGRPIELDVRDGDNNSYFRASRN